LIKRQRSQVHTEWAQTGRRLWKQAFVVLARQILAPAESNRSPKNFFPLQKRIAYCGMFNSLSSDPQNSFGDAGRLPGNELWDLSLSTRTTAAVDYAKRR